MTGTEGHPVFLALDQQVVLLQQTAALLESEIQRAASPRKATQLQRRAAHRRLWADRIRDHLREQAR